MGHRMQSLADLLDATPASLWAFDAEGVCTAVQGGGSRQIGHGLVILEGTNLLDACPETSELGRLIRCALQGQAATRDHEPEPGVLLQTSCRPVYDEQLALLGGVALTVDITHRRAGEEEGNRGGLLDTISRDLVTSIGRGPEATAQTIAEAAASVVGETALVLPLGTDGELAGAVGLAWRDADPAAGIDADLAELVPLWASMRGWPAAEQVLRESRSVYLDSLPAELLALMTQRLGEPLTRRLAAHRLAIVPMRDQQAVIGVIVVLRQAMGAFTAAERAHLDAVGERAGPSLTSSRLLDTARRLMADRRALLGHLIDAEVAERRRLAHDIHDDTIQVLAAVDLRLQLLRRRIADRPDCAAELEVLDGLRESTQDATSRLRRLLFELMPPALERGGIATALRQLAEDVFDGTSTQVAVVDHTVHSPDMGSAVALFRVGREALVNARKHAQAASVTVTLDSVDGGTRLTVDDDGVGLPEPVHQADARQHPGLAGMRDRAKIAGGRFSIRRGTDRGTVVEVWFPLD